MAFAPGWPLAAQSTGVDWDERDGGKLCALMGAYIAVCSRGEMI
jgi:hypothetical protein